MSIQTSKHRRNRWRIIIWVIVGVLALSLISGCAAVTVMPSVGAEAADWLRGIVGDEAVAELETFVYQVLDDVHQMAYSLGVAPPESPFQSTPVAAAATSLPTDLAPVAPTGTPGAPSSASTTPAPALSPSPAGTRSASGTQAPTPAPLATATVTAVPWTLAPLQPLGTLAGEGQWQAYMNNAAGQVVVYRTFLQPDQQRPYAVAVVVAFDLNATHLHLVLGSLEPASAVKIPRPGTIPADDLQAGKLLATFNGGFKAAHGHFGLMIGGVTVIPPRDAMGTVAFYADGHVNIGQWGTDITPSPDVVAWRQNGPLVIQNGQINPHTADDTVAQDWGYTVPGKSAVWRSGIGISADRKTLYYIAGPNLTLPVLATAMEAAGMSDAIQLDINNFWVHFDAIDNQLHATPLVTNMNNSVGRYLSAYPRDFFYVTADGG